MKLDYLKDHLTNKKELAPTVLLGVSVLCVVLIIVKVTSFFVASARAESVVRRAIVQSGTGQKNLEKLLAESAAITDELKKNNLFAPPPAKQHPVKEVSGIFGDQVLIQNKWYNVGDKIGDAKIIAIGPTSVIISWDGREQTFLPIQAAVAEAPSGPGEPGGRAASEKEAEATGLKNEKGEGGPEVTAHIEEGSMEFGNRGGPGEGFMAMRQRFENMSEEERQAFRDRMRERFGRDRGGPGGGMDFVRRGGPGGRGPGEER
jgi:hypothetical protein